jgi:flap endonuclease-1
MGTTAIRDLATIEERPLSACAGWRVAVDAHNWLYRYQSPVVRYRSADVYTAGDGTEVPHLLGALKGLVTLAEHGLDPVFVFDGSPVDLKREEIAARRAERERAEELLATAREAGDPEAIRKYRAQTQRLSEHTLSTTRELLSLLSVPVVEAPAAGEAQAAHMVRTGAADAVVSDDYDAPLFGAPRTLRQCSGTGPAELLDLETTLADLAIDHRQLVDVALLCGTDYNDGVDGVGPTYGLRGVREHGTAEAYLADRDGSLPAAEAVRAHYLDPPVTDVTVAETAAPDVDAAREFLRGWDLPADEVEPRLSRLARARS